MKFISLEKAEGAEAPWTLYCKGDNGIDFYRAFNTREQALGWCWKRDVQNVPPIKDEREIAEKLLWLQEDLVKFKEAAAGTTAAIPHIKVAFLEGAAFALEWVLGSRDGSKED